MAETGLRVRLQSAYHTEAEWEAITTIPLEGEICYTKDSASTHNGWYKVGNGTDTWSDLPYVTQPGTGVSSVITGDNNGTIKVNTDGVVTNVPVKGLGSAAYADTEDFVSQSDIDQLRTSKAPIEQGVEYIKATQAAATNAWTGVSSSTTLFDGKQIAYYIPFANTSAVTLNLTLASTEATGPKPVYIHGITPLSNEYPAESVIRMTWDATKEAWIVDGESTANTFEGLKVFDASFITGVNGIQPNSLFMADGEGKYQSFTTDGGLEAKTRNTEGLRLGDIWFNSSATAYINGQTTEVNTTYITKQINLRYSTNASSFVINQPVYLVGSLGADGLFYLNDPWWTQTLPDEEDDLLYVYLGHTYNTTSINLSPTHPVYFYMSNAIHQWFGPEATTAVSGNMSAADKTKLDGVEEGANNYVLPVASPNELGGVKPSVDISVLPNGLMRSNVYYYDYDYELTPTTATFTAHLYRGAEDVTSLFSEYNFTWWKKVEDGIYYLGRGATLTLNLSEMQYFGSVIGRWNDAHMDIGIATNSGEQFVTDTGAILITS